MEKLLKDLLAYSRIGTRIADLYEVDTVDVVEDALHRLSRDIKRSGARLTCQDLPKILADRSQLVLLFQHLLSNSIKFHTGDREVSIEVGSKVSKKEILFWVKDNGIGIEENLVAKVFQIFQRLHSYELYEGNGIGLAICKRIVNLMGGRIWIESVFGKGSKVIFTLPNRYRIR